MLSNMEGIYPIYEVEVVRKNEQATTGIRPCCPAIPSQSMPTPYQRQPSYGLNLARGAIGCSFDSTLVPLSGTTASMEEYSPGTGHSAEASPVNAYTDWCATPLANMVTSEPMSPELCRQMEILYGTIDRTSVALPIDVVPAVEAYNADNFAYAQSAGAYMHSYPTPLPNMVASGPTFKIEPRRNMDALHGINSNEAKVETQTDEAHAHIATTLPHPISATARCQWIGMGNSGTCNVHITSESAPAHFRKFHGINRLNEDILVCCLWEGCFKQLKRKYFVRHIREHHLGCRRKKKHPLL
ncbi:hypothetical protein L210DRAFT_671188 [Boletus edulis BED1]|uniref:Uncharacterized protein n=1 Tax=Boletus edulis BED1 TaxID=1328754 RepID=A0AAD4BEQ5_BOLED|nr:hypothetical protein L210DRAFT_671188 [Boletus edulis BED1]